MFFNVVQLHVMLCWSAWLGKAILGGKKEEICPKCQKTPTGYFSMLLPVMDLIRSLDEPGKSQDILSTVFAS